MSAAHQKEPLYPLIRCFVLSLESNPVVRQRPMSEAPNLFSSRSDILSSFSEAMYLCTLVFFAIFLFTPLSLITFLFLSCLLDWSWFLFPWEPLFAAFQEKRHVSQNMATSFCLSTEKPVRIAHTRSDWFLSAFSPPQHVLVSFPSAPKALRALPAPSCVTFWLLCRVCLSSQKGHFAFLLQS